MTVLRGAGALDCSWLTKLLDFRDHRQTPVPVLDSDPESIRPFSSHPPDAIAEGLDTPEAVRRCGAGSKKSRSTPVFNTTSGSRDGKYVNEVAGAFPDYDLIADAKIAHNVLDPDKSKHGYMVREWHGIGTLQIVSVDGIRSTSTPRMTFGTCLLVRLERYQSSFADR